MKGSIYLNKARREECIAVAQYIVQNKATVRSAANEFSIPKSSIHRMVTEELEKFNYNLAQEVKKVFEINNIERHKRGGETTRKRFSKKQAV